VIASVGLLLVAGPAIAEEMHSDAASLASRPAGTWLDQPSEWFGSGIGIAALGTAISGMVPGAVLGFLSTWLVCRHGKRR
jgi:hypothetical protein